MSTAALPRHLLKWVLSLDLTYPIKHPKRDFANGFLVAEVLSKYFPDDVQMHSIENVTSIERKKSNWHLLKKFFKRYDVPVSKDDVDQVMAAADGAIVKLLQIIYNYVHEDPAAQSEQQPEYHEEQQYYHPTAMPGYSSGSAYSPSSPYSPSGVSQQPAGESWPQQYPAGMQYPSPMAMQQAPQYSQQMFSAGMPHHMQAPQQMMGNTVQYAAGYQPGGYTPGQDQHEGSMPSIEYDRRPRAVEYKPYTQQDYSSRNYDAKMQKEYWKLGTLGPQIEDEDLQAKRKKAEELKDLARSIREKNARLASMATATARPKVETPKSKSVREKALEFARNVPRPEMKRAASTGSSSGESTPKRQPSTSASVPPAKQPAYMEL
ncbi:hypothetical protein WJX82_000533 [Trebouxia sp. C0006]